MFWPFRGPKARERDRASRDGLTVLRSVWLSLVLSLILFGIVFAYIAPIDGGDEGWLPTAVIAIGVATLVGVVWIARRPWGSIPSTPEMLADVYRRDFFIQVGVAELAALFSLAGLFVVQNSLWVYFVGGSFTFLGFLIAAPSSANISRRQHEITASGSRLSLLDALLHLLPPRR